MPLVDSDELDPLRGTEAIAWATESRKVLRFLSIHPRSFSIMIPVTINGNTIDLAGPDSKNSSTDASKSNFVFLQCNRQLTPQDYEELPKHNVIVQEFVGKNTYLCGYKPSDLAVLEALPFVNHARVYYAGFTKHAALGVFTDPNIGLEDHIYINIHLHEGVVEGGKDLLEKIQKFLTAEMIDFNDSQLRCHVPLKYIDAIAAIDQVRTVEECLSITFHDAKAVDIIYGDQPKLSVPKYKGAGQIISVADAGFNKSSSAFVHPAFQDRLVGISDKVVLLLTEKKE
jgi:serine protease AprX